MAKGKGMKTPKGVSNSSRTNIQKTLEAFQASDALVFKFEEELTNEERALVHTSCRRMGMKSKSSGKGKMRRVTVSKKKKDGSEKKGEKLTPVGFMPEARQVLGELFTQYPPLEDGEDGGCSSVAGKASRRNHSRRGSDPAFLKPILDAKQIAAKAQYLAFRTQTNPDMKQIAAARAKLPIAAFQDQITSTVQSHQVVLISGATGCGKTTQVPQYLLDDMWGKGKSCKVVCTQPRRISATSVAERIATERGENIGDNIGYKIRLESKGGRQSSVMFCTNGLLLRVLVSEGVKSGSSNTTIRDITHIIVDEIHERDRYSDFMLAILRDILPCYPELRVILMSATLDAERFSDYFGGCPILRVPGFTYPVKSYYLEDVLSLLHLQGSGTSCEQQEVELSEDDKADLDEAINSAWLNDEFETLLELVSEDGTEIVYNYQHSSTGLTALMVFAGKGSTENVSILLSLGADCELKAMDGATALDLAEQKNHSATAEVLKHHMENNPSSGKLLDKYISETNQEFVDIRLIEKLLMKICLDSEDGAILVFLPGWDDINKIHEKLLNNAFFKDPNKFEILALHSMIPAIDQRKVFIRLPPGVRKIVLSTNIAETSVTIDDVVYVIDSGRLKEKSYDPYSNVSTLQSSWVSKASARQREGRAGRCQPGVCYHLFGKDFAASLPNFQVPEIRRMPVEELCLQVKLIDPDCRIIDFMEKTLDPPIRETIQNALVILQDIGALTGDENLTELGVKLGSLPLHPVTSKMLFMAILMNCLEPALTIACMADFKSPFTIPVLPQEKKKANAAKAELAMLLGGHSDQLAVVAAFECWKNAKKRGSERRFCSKYFISSTTMNMLSMLRKQLQTELKRIGLIPEDEDVSKSSLNGRDPAILHAVLLAGLYPMVGKLIPPVNAGSRVLVDTANHDKVRLHPSSTNHGLALKGQESRPLVMYDEITRADFGMHIRNCTIFGPLPLLFLSAEISVVPLEDDDDDDEDDDDDVSDVDDYGEGGRIVKIMESPDNPVVIVVDRWLRYKSTAIDVAQLYLLRQRLSAAILFKVNHPRDILPPVLGVSVYVIACILSCAGLSGIPLMSKSVESLTKKVNATEINESSKETTSIAPPKANADDNYLRELFYQQNDNNGFKSRNSFRESGRKASNPARHEKRRRANRGR